MALLRTIVSHKWRTAATTRDQHKQKSDEGQRDLPVLGLDLPRIFQDAHVDEQISWRFQASREVDVGPLAFVSSQKIPVLPNVVFFLRAQTAGTRIVARSSAAPHRRLLTWELLEIDAAPDQLLQLVSPRTVVGEQAPFVPPHREVVHQQRACGCLLRSRVE